MKKSDSVQSDSSNSQPAITSENEPRVNINRPIHSLNQLSFAFKDGTPELNYNGKQLEFDLEEPVIGKNRITYKMKVKNSKARFVVIAINPDELDSM